MVYSTGCVAEDLWRRGGWCALVGNGFTFMIQDARSHEIKIKIKIKIPDSLKRSLFMNMSKSCFLTRLTTQTAGVGLQQIP
jgi:hypothetical protein